MANEVVQTVLGQNVKSYKKDPDPKPYTKVVLTVDENTVYTAGDDTGITLEAECPWGSQAMANALLRQINGWVYRPFDAEGALLNPAIEIGDGAVINEDELGIFKRNTTYSPLAMADISSPSDEEIDHEFPWVSAQQRETDRKFVVVNDTIQANYSEFKTTASEISASVTAVDTNKLDHTSATQTMSWSLTSDGFYINNSDTADDNHFKFKVDANGAEVNGTIRATAGEIGSFYIGSSDLHTRIKDGNEYVERTDHNSGTRGIKIDSSGISMGDGTEQTFYVTNSGYLTARHGTFGSLTVNNEGKTTGGFYGGLNGCTGSVSDLGGSISSDMGIGFGMTIGNLVSTADQAYTTSAQVLRDLGNYMAGSITANAFKATTINCSNLYLGNRALYTNGIYAAVPGTYSGTCRIVVDGQTRLGSCSITISGANYAAVNFQQ